MSVLKRGGHYHLQIRPFGTLINVATKANSRAEARKVEMAVLTACRTNKFEFLDEVSRETCIRLFKNQGWSMPGEVTGEHYIGKPPDTILTFWKACQYFLNYPEVKASPGYWRHQYSIANLATHFGKETPLKSIWVPQLKEYQVQRVQADASPETVNHEMSTLSRIFAVMIEMQMADVNPVRLIRKLSSKSSLRQVYLSFELVKLFPEVSPEWFGPILWTAYYTGMRRGEILGLTRKQVNLSRRMITLSPEDTKEVHWKRVPIHQNLVSILEKQIHGSSTATIGGNVFTLQDKQGIRGINVETFKNVWPRACEALKKMEALKEPFPRFHDLRHTWRTNARRSGIDSQIAETIMGHWFKEKSVNDRYGRISDAELIQAIDRMTFEHGETEILVANNRAK